MTDIRRLKPHEVPLLLPGARAFMAEGYARGQLNEAHFVKAFTALLEEGRALVLVAGAPFRGSIGGIFYEDMITAEFCCAEHFWYVHAAERGSLGVRLLRQFERIVFGERHAKRLVMMHHVEDRSNGAERVYQSRGYALLEQVYVKTLEGFSL